MTPIRLEPAALRSRVKHSTTEPLRSLKPGSCGHPTKYHFSIYCCMNIYCALRPSFSIFFSYVGTLSSIAQGHNTAPLVSLRIETLRSPSRTLYQLSHCLSAYITKITCLSTFTTSNCSYQAIITHYTEIIEKKYKKGTSRQFKILRKCFEDCILIISGLVTGYVSTDKRRKETKQGTTIAYILNRKRNAYFNYCVFCTNWVINNNRNDMKATNDAWNMCINKSIVDSWFFGVNGKKGITLSIIT